MGAEFGVAMELAAKQAQLFVTRIDAIFAHASDVGLLVFVNDGHGRGGGRRVVGQFQRLRWAGGIEDGGKEIVLIAELRAQPVVAAVDSEDAVAQRDQGGTIIHQVGGIGQASRRRPLLALIAQGVAVPHFAGASRQRMMPQQ